MTTKHSATFTYQSQEIVFHFWASDPKNTDSPPDTILFLGTGQVAKIPKWVAQSALPGTVIVEGLPHWFSAPDASDLLEFSNEYTACAFEAVLREFGVSSMHIIGESQATPGTIWLANKLPQKVRNVGLIVPMGLNTAQLGATDDDRFKELRRRTLRTLLQLEQSPLRDPRNLYIGVLLAKIVISGLRDGSTVKKYRAGISKDMLQEFAALTTTAMAHQRQVILFIGSKDKLFPEHEISKSLQSAGITNVQVKTMTNVSHSSLGIRASKTPLRHAIQTVRSAKP